MSFTASLDTQTTEQRNGLTLKNFLGIYVASVYTVFTYGFPYNVFIYKRLGLLGPMWLVNELDLCFGPRVTCVKFEVNSSRIVAVRVRTDKDPISYRYK